MKGGKAKLHNTKSLVAIDGGTGTGIDAPVFAYQFWDVDKKLHLIKLG